MPVKAHAHRGWPPMVTNNAQYKIISENPRAMCKHKKHTKNKHKIQSVSEYIRATKIQHIIDITSQI